MTVTLVENRADLAAVAERAARAPSLGVDAEANGLHAFRPTLCTLQLAWVEAGEVAVAVIDSLAVPVASLSPLLGARGPVKVLHDLTFDARLLAEAGAPLARVRDTSVAARLLGFTATGLATLLAGELGVAHGKDLQQHDWSRRPLGPAEIAYLAGDVRHLLALDEHLAQKAEALDIAPEVADECAYKLATALAPPRDARPAYVRIKGAAALDAPGRAVLRRLCQARDEVAAAADVPPFKVVSSETLLELAVKRPRDRAALVAVRGALAGTAGRWTDRWLGAVADGLGDGDVPAAEQALFTREPPRSDEIKKRRARDRAVSAWRRDEAALRGLDAQAVLPGHCAQDLVDALLANDEQPDAAALREAIARIPGLGARRIERHMAAFLALAEEAALPPTKPPVSLEP
jgi:ribonuclease D